MLSIVLLTLTLGGSDPMTNVNNWHRDAFFGLHYDLHPGPSDTELGRETTYEHIREQLEKAKPDFVQYDCKGHPGWAGYPTKVGSPSPGIVNDALKIWRQVTKDMGIPLSIHFSGVWDTRAIELHPEWANVNAAGHPSPNNTCPLSAYTEELMIPQLLEVVEEYDIDGMWIDGENWASAPCWCERCKAEFTKRTGFESVPSKRGDEHWSEWLAFHRDLFTEHVTKFCNAVHAKDPEVMVCSNWMYSVRQPDPVKAPVDYLSGDFDPSFGADRACAEGRFISSRGMPWDLMAWSFLRTGPLGWTFKNATHLSQEVSEVLAQGGAVFIYDTPQRSGRLNSWHQDILGEVGEFCRRRKDFCFKTETIPQVAILHSQTYFYAHNDPLFNFAEGNQPMEGALHAVLENGYSADILNEDALLERAGDYPVVVVPEQEGLPKNVIDGLTAYVKNGGRLLLTGPNVAREWAELAGVEVLEGQQGGGFLPVERGAVTVPGPWPNLKCGTATELARLLYQQEPELNQTETPAATLNQVGQGAVAAIHGPMCLAYYQGHYPMLRDFIGMVLEALQAPGLIRLDGPSYVEMATRRKDGAMYIQFVNRSNRGLSPSRHMVEEVPDSGPFSVTVPVATRPEKCYLAPDDPGLEWTWKDGVLTAEIAGLGIHNVLVIE